MPLKICQTTLVLIRQQYVQEIHHKLNIQRKKYLPIAWMNIVHSKLVAWLWVYFFIYGWYNLVYLKLDWLRRPEWGALPQHCHSSIFGLDCCRLTQSPALLFLKEPQRAHFVSVCIRYSNEPTDHGYHTFLWRGKSQNIQHHHRRVQCLHRSSNYKSYM